MNPTFLSLTYRAHLFLEQFTPAEIAEERLEDDNATGQLDVYDPCTQTLYDYKTWGSYRVAKALGLEVIEVPTGEFYKSGPKKGREKMHKEVHKGNPDMKDVELQVNHYRTLIESVGFPAKAMYIEAIVRDGGTYIAKKTEAFLYNYNLDKVFIVNAKIELEALHKAENIGFINVPGDIKTSKTYKFHSDTETEAISIVERTKKLQTMINFKQNQIDSIDRAINILTEDEKAVIVMRYFEGRQWWEIANRLKFNERWCRERRRRAINKVVAGLFGAEDGLIV